MVIKKVLKKLIFSNSAAELHCSIINYTTQVADLQRKQHHNNHHLTLCRSVSETRLQTQCHADPPPEPITWPNVRRIQVDLSRLTANFMLHWHKDAMSVHGFILKMEAYMCTVFNNSAQAIVDYAVKITFLEPPVNVQLSQFVSHFTYAWNDCSSACKLLAEATCVWYIYTIL